MEKNEKAMKIASMKYYDTVKQLDNVTIFYTFYATSDNINTNISKNLVLFFGNSCNKADKLFLATDTSTDFKCSKNAFTKRLNLVYCSF